MVIDLNRILMYADKSGRLRDAPARRILSVVDGIVGGEGNGPLDACPKRSGMIVAGSNPVAVDLACARLMGFDYKRLPVLCHMVNDNHPLPLLTFRYDELVCRSNAHQYDRMLSSWSGHVCLSASLWVAWPC